MTPRLFFVAFVLSAIACNNSAPKTYERIERFENGNISRRFNLINGKKEGKMTDYFISGKVMAERYFANDEQEGRTIIYYPEGQVKEVQYFVAGKKQGGDTLWYENGKVEFVTTLKNDKKDGYLRKWSPEGELVYEAKYAQDTLIEVKGQPIDRNTSAAKPSKLLKEKD